MKKAITILIVLIVGLPNKNETKFLGRIVDNFF